MPLIVTIAPVLMWFIKLQETAIKADATIEDAVHVLAFVVPCEAVSDEEYMAKLIEIKEYARLRGVHLTFVSAPHGNMQQNATLAPGTALLG